VDCHDGERSRLLLEEAPPPLAKVCPMCLADPPLAPRRRCWAAATLGPPVRLPADEGPAPLSGPADSAAAAAAACAAEASTNSAPERGDEREDGAAAVPAEAAEAARCPPA